MGDKNTPLVSVVTTTYNWPDALKVAISTVLEQSFENFEYLIIGDCCTDETEAEVRKFRDPRIKWLNLDKNTGNQSGVNKIALQMAKGKYIAYLNHDDLWFPDHLSSLLSPMQEQDIDVISSLSINIKPPGYDYRQILGFPWGINPTTLGVYPMTSNVMHTAAAARLCGGWKDWREITQVPTQEFFARLRALRGRFGVLNSVTALKFHSGDRKNSYVDRAAAEQIHYYNLIKTDPGMRYREVMKAITFEIVGEQAQTIPQPEPPKNPKPGWQIEQWRRMRGLEPMLDLGNEEPGTDMKMPAKKPSVVSIMADDSALVLNPAGK